MVAFIMKNPNSNGYDEIQFSKIQYCEEAIKEIHQLGV